jgi:hypothetical protein
MQEVGEGTAGLPGGEFEARRLRDEDKLDGRHSSNSKTGSAFEDGDKDELIPSSWPVHDAPLSNGML